MFGLQKEKKNIKKNCGCFESLFCVVALQTNAQLGTLCCNWELGIYHELESSHIVSHYKHNLSLLN